MTMTKKTKWIFGALLIAGGYLVYRYLRGTPPTVGNSISAADTKDDGKKGSAYIYPLKRGANGEIVGLLQQALGGKQNLPKFGVDKKFGYETEAAVQKFLGKKTVDNFDEIIKIGNLNNLAYDPSGKKFYKPLGGVTSKVSDVLNIKK